MFPIAQLASRGFASCEVRDDLDPRPQTRSQKCCASEAEATGGARPWRVEQVAAKRCGRNVGIVRERHVECERLGGRRALLGAERERRARRTAQRVIDVGCDLERDLAQAQIEHGEVDRREARQRGAAQRKLVARGVAEPHAERGQHAGPAGGRWASADRRARRRARDRSRRA